MYTNNKLRSQNTKYVQQQQTKKKEHKVCTNNKHVSQNKQYDQQQQTKKTQHKVCTTTTN